jgi:fructose-bisphosphate aldolase class I
VPGLQKVAAFVAPGKGILAADASIATMSRRLEAGVDPRGIVLKSNMIVSGVGHEEQAGPAEVTRATSQVLTATVPPAVPGIAFLYGRQSNVRACANPAAINAQAAADDTAPSRQTFSFGRALVEDALRTWRGVTDNNEDAQRKLADNCQRANQASAAGSPDCAQPLSNERQAGRA